MEISELKNHIETINKQFTELTTLLNTDQLKQTIQDVESKTYNDGFWDDHESANKVIETLKHLKQKDAQVEALKDKIENLELALELLEIGETVETAENDVKTVYKALESFEIDVYLSENYDKFNAIIEIHPGAGGTESQDWAEMLYRMISRYAEQNNFSLHINDYQAGLEAGIKSITATIEGAYAYGKLKSEAGVHRLVRLSPFDSSGRRHTSFASVNVIPEIDDSIDIEINENDLKIDTYRSSGAGGQSVNTTDSAVRITHLPTNLAVTCQNERSQIKNRAKAMQILKGKLYQLELKRQKEALDTLKDTSKSNAFGSQIRSYVMHPYSMVKDHRTNQETGNVAKVLDGDLEPFMHSYLKMLAKEDA